MMPLKLPKNTMKKTLNVWDIDDTLFKTSARVSLMKGGKHIKYLEPGEYTQYKLEDDEQFDFSQFRSGKQFRESAVPVEKVLDRAKEIIKNNNGDSESIILTARSDFDDHHEFLATFRDHGFPIDQVYIERSGNLAAKYNNGSGPHIYKAAIIRKYIATGKYKRIRMWDDSESNLRILLKLGRLHPEIEMIGYLVSKDGQSITRYALQLDENIKIPHSGLNFSRTILPQIEKKNVTKYLKFLDTNNISYKETKIEASKLKPTQGEFNLERINGFINKKSLKKDHILISNDHYILDGHHRWLVQYNINPKVKLDAYIIDLPITELLNLTRRFEGVEYKKVTDKIKKLVSESYNHK